MKAIATVRNSAVWQCRWRELVRIYLAALWLPAICLAQDIPKWEAGAGIGVASMQDYRGSDQRKTYGVPLPYLVYRGDFLQVDRNRVRGILFKTDVMSADISVYGSPPVKDNDARRGMPDLDALLEIGPQLTFFLQRGTADRPEMTLRLPVRAVRRIGDEMGKEAGWLFNPSFDAEWTPSGGWKKRLSIGPLFADRKYHDYFYGVAPEYAVPDRPAYAARGGYSGMQLFANASKRFGNIWVGMFLQADQLKGAAFEDSPLAKKNLSLSAGFGVSWVFAESGSKISTGR
jgi:outer membrane scaffolding protein for murein synthesis (MipA/OmpV family)